METKCDHVKLEKWRIKLGFCGKLVVNSLGKSGGLCLYWINNVVVDLLTYSQCHIDVMISGLGSKRWRFTGFYGHPEQSQMKHSWTLLWRLACMSTLPWVCMGDFNEIFSDKEKLGGVPKNWKDISDFREVVEECNLEDMGYIGPCFTWSNKTAGASLIMERLDRSFCTRDWGRLFPQYVIRHLEFFG
ncbi:hypothetical protein Dsin_000529 [Dipteronia sinensis]|uniref:Endonuclease/exonuclease/phosphatase domain-containing protein n=1 Tax=Dipteronia sinensis TaxID=43782 RepID=A0AAE0B2Z9_9ROSI|nr:hypothetical protein Dsin_000529 [Dipteronia sinensis]